MHLNIVTFHKKLLFVKYQVFEMHAEKKTFSLPNSCKDFEEVKNMKNLEPVNFVKTCGFLIFQNKKINANTAES